MAAVRTTCPYCGVGCGVLATPDGRGGVAIAGDPEHPANFGRLCSKGSALGETVGLDGRLLAPAHPRARRRPGTRRSTSSPAGIRSAIDTRGPESVAIYGSGQLLTEDYYVANKLMKGFIGAANIDTNSRLCMASAGRRPPPRLRRRHRARHLRGPGGGRPRRARRLEPRLVPPGALPAPRRRQGGAAGDEGRHRRPAPHRDQPSSPTSTSRSQPDTDVALFNALLAEIARRGAVDAAYVAAHVAGFDAAARGGARPPTPARHRPRAADLAAFLDLWIGTEKVVTVFSQGVNQSASGTDKVNAIINCHLATGRIGRPGMGPF